MGLCEENPSVGHLPDTSYAALRISSTDEITDLECHVPLNKGAWWGVEGAAPYKARGRQVAAPTTPKRHCRGGPLCPPAQGSRRFGLNGT